MSRIYLAKAGKITGPLGAAEFEKLKRDGDLLGFSWIWNTEARRWDPLDPAPSAPPGLATSTRSRGQSSAAHWRGLLHDGRSVQDGSLGSVTETDCELVVDGLVGSPAFGAGARLELNLFDPKSGKTITVPARLASTARRGQSWLLKLEWSGLPAIFDAA